MSARAAAEHLRWAEIRLRRAARQVRDARLGCRRGIPGLPAELRNVYGWAATRCVIGASDDLRVADRALEAAMAILTGEALVEDAEPAADHV